MKISPLPLRAVAVAAIILLAACHPRPPAEATDNSLANAAVPVVLPPAIKATKTYRCKDNSVIYVTFMTDDTTAAVREKETDPPIATLMAPEKGKPFVTPGYSLSSEDDTVDYLSPTTPKQSCHV